MYFSFSLADKDGLVDLTDSTRCICVTLISVALILPSYHQQMKQLVLSKNILGYNSVYYYTILYSISSLLKTYNLFMFV